MPASPVSGLPGWGAVALGHHLVTEGHTMSAFVVDRFTIHLLLTAAPDRVVVDTLRDVYPGQTVDESDMDALRSVLGRYLWSMNVRSVLYRYPSDTVDTVPGERPACEWGMIYSPLPEYEYRRTRIGHHGTGSVGGMSKADAARVLGAAYCYRYQSCELPEWNGTPAARFVSGVIDHAAHALSVDWEYTESDDMGGPVSIMSLVGNTTA